MMEETSNVATFSHLATKLECLTSRENQEMLLQWNLNESLLVEKFRFSGSFTPGLSSEYERVLKDFFNSSNCPAILGVMGIPTSPFTLDKDHLSTSVLSMDFFDRLTDSDIVTTSGSIRGCFEEQYDGISVGDKLREFLLNEDSENASLYSEEERKQFIFAIFKIFAVGGAMCQSDATIERLFRITKSFYKEMVTVYRDSKTQEVQISGRVYKINNVQGLSLFTTPESVHNQLFIVIDPLKKEINVIKKNFKPYW